MSPVLSGRRQAPLRWHVPLAATFLLASAMVGSTFTSPGAAAQASASASQRPALAIPAAGASITGVFWGGTVSGDPVPCTAQSDGVRVCHGTYNDGPGGSDVRVKSFDGVPLEVYVILPPAPGSGADGPYPLVVQSHGWASQAGGVNFTPGGIGPSADAWAKQGYAVVQLTARGLHASCGSPAAQAATPGACTNGYIRLDDERYEARDIQYTAGLLADAGVVYPDRIAATGPSYGGGVSLELATLKDRVMNQDGTLSPWKSPDGTPMRLAAAAPEIPWSDLAYSLMPNGRTLDYRITPPNADTTPIGVEKQSFFSREYAAGLPPNGYYSTTDPQANLPGWYGAVSAGEPYDTDPLAEQFVSQLNRFHSPYYLLDGAYGTPREAPAPMLIANGFTDDLFPVDEALRYYNLERALYPSDPIDLVDGDFGHEPAANKPGDIALLSGEIQALFDHYLQGTGAAPRPGTVTATIETCPSTVPSGGPVRATSWSALHPGEVDYTAGSPQTIISSAGNPAISSTIDPWSGAGACATVSSADQGDGVATYRLPAATGSGYTLLGSPTVIANLKVSGQYPVIAERLWDVNPATGTETLVARGTYRPDSSHPGVQVFQLHPGAWHFATGHVPKLELLGQDSPYVRTSNGQFSITVTGLHLRLPAHEVPRATGTPTDVRRPLPFPTEPVTRRS